MSDALLVYCRPAECSYCIALARNLETALAELAALKRRRCGEWCPMFEKGMCIGRDPGQHCAAINAASLAAREETP